MRKILGYFFLIAGGIVVLFSRNYHSHVIPWPLAWSLLGLGMSVFGSYIVALDRRLKKSRKNNSERKSIEEFKLSAHKIIVPFDQCEIITGYDKIVDDMEIRRLDGSIAPTILPQVREPKVDQDAEFCRIVFKKELQGKEIKFISHTINKNLETVMFLFANKKILDLYIDKYDPAKYWFDLDFLNA